LGHMAKIRFEELEKKIYEVDLRALDGSDQIMGIQLSPKIFSFFSKGLWEKTRYMPHDHSTGSSEVQWRGGNGEFKITPNHQIKPHQMLMFTEKFGAVILEIMAPPPKFEYNDPQMPDDLLTLTKTKQATEPEKFEKALRKL
jgi:hypothetical protein